MLDILQERDFDQEALDQLEVMRFYGDIDLWASAKSYCDCFYFMKKTLGREIARNSLEGSLSWLNICSLDGDDIRTGISQRWPDLEDCLTNISAEKIKADYLITRDKKGFEQSSIPHGSVADFMDYVAETLHLTYAIEGM